MMEERVILVTNMAWRRVEVLWVRSADNMIVEAVTGFDDGLPVWEGVKPAAEIPVLLSIPERLFAGAIRDMQARGDRLPPVDRAQGMYEAQTQHLEDMRALVAHALKVQSWPTKK